MASPHLSQRIRIGRSLNPPFHGAAVAPICRVIRRARRVFARDSRVRAKRCSSSLELAPLVFELQVRHALQSVFLRPSGVNRGADSGP